MILRQGNTRCLVCKQHLFRPSDPETAPLALAYLCRHVLHASCALSDKSVALPERPVTSVQTLYTSRERDQGSDWSNRETAKNLGAKLAFGAAVRVRVTSCPVCTEHPARVKLR